MGAMMRMMKVRNGKDESRGSPMTIGTLADD